MDKVGVFQIEKKNSMIQIQLVPINIFSQVFFFKFIYGVLQGDNFLAGYFKFTYFNFFFYSGFLAGSVSFPSNKKDS